MGAHMCDIVIVSVAEFWRVIACDRTRCCGRRCCPFLKSTSTATLRNSLYQSAKRKKSRPSSRERKTHLVCCEGDLKRQFNGVWKGLYKRNKKQTRKSNEQKGYKGMHSKKKAKMRLRKGFLVLQCLHYERRGAAQRSAVGSDGKSGAPTSNGRHGIPSMSLSKPLLCWDITTTQFDLSWCFITFSDLNWMEVFEGKVEELCMFYFKTLSSPTSAWGWAQGR